MPLKIRTLYFFLVILLFGACEKDLPEKDLLTIGVFGGSVCSSVDAEDAKFMWAQNLNVRVVTNGVGGAGFSAKTLNNVPSQIEKAEPFDIYVLWASTNDIYHTLVGDLLSEDVDTQTGGIKRAVELIKKKNKEAKICLFTSLPIMNKKENDRLKDFVEGQKKICQFLGIDYLDQNSLCGFDESNWEKYYLPDRTHLKREGYLHLVDLHINFLRQFVNDKKMESL